VDVRPLGDHAILSKSEGTVHIATPDERQAIAENSIWSPGGGLWFDEPHFRHCDPPQVLEMFTQRAARLAKSQLEGWQRMTRENEEAAWAAEEVMKHD
jgi:hypothetical protein